MELLRARAHLYLIQHMLSRICCSSLMMSGAFPQNIDPTLLLTAFLPILLFAGAFALEWHTVRRLIWSSLLLAGEP